MKCEPTEIADAWLIAFEPAHDTRGFFVRTFCQKEFAARDLCTSFPQHSLSHSTATGTLRGMHFQTAPHAEIKLVRCTKGAIWDVIVDLRPGSPTFRRWQGFRLDPDNRLQLYIPKGLAHGFQTLLPETEVSYLISEWYEPTAASGVRYDDPALKIRWPLPPVQLSAKDQTWPLLD
jgi:dTDP-4-dehydrorhamnose 3,5-epimerase